MSLRDELTADLAEAFDTELADAVTEFQATHHGKAEHDPVTGVVTPGDVPYSGRGVVGGYRNEEIDGTLILATDKKLTALQAEVTRAPAVGDTLAGMRVMRVGEDPAKATWRVQLRA